VNYKACGCDESTHCVECLSNGGGTNSAETMESSESSSYTVSAPKDSCPHCGRCPTCGHVPHQVWSPPYWGWDKSFTYRLY
jgi:hypothetical protein